MILRKFALLTIMLLGIGIAAGYPCPNPQTWTNFPEVQSVQIYHQSISGDEYEFLIQGYVGESVKEVCIADKDGYTRMWSSGTATWPNWNWESKQEGSNYFVQWRDHGQDNIPMDGNIYSFGTVTLIDQDWDTKLTSLVHLVNEAYCQQLGLSPDSCYVRPKPPTQPIPEMSTLVLMSTGLIGLVLASRKYRNR